MIVGTILLTTDNFYIDDKGKLPARPEFDKTLLTALCEGETVSSLGYHMLPPSIRTVVGISHGEPTMPITIKEIAGLADLLIVVRSNEKLVRGKQFRLDNFNLIVKDRKTEIWRRK